LCEADRARFSSKGRALVSGEWRAQSRALKAQCSMRAEATINFSLPATRAARFAPLCRHYLHINSAQTPSAASSRQAPPMPPTSSRWTAPFLAPKGRQQRQDGKALAVGACPSAASSSVLLPAAHPRRPQTRSAGRFSLHRTEINWLDPCLTFAGRSTGSQ